MRLVICCINYDPEITGTGKYTTEMTRWLADRGHDVHMVTAYPYYPEWHLRPGWPAWRYSRSKDSGVDVVRCPLWVPHRVSGPKRVAHLLSFSLSATPVLLASFAWKPDYIVCVAPTIAVAPAVLLAARLSRSKALLHVQDLEVDAASGLRMLGKPGISLRLALRLQDWLIRRFDLVTTISEEMAERIVAKGASPGSVALVPNWVTRDLLDEHGCGADFRSEFGIKDDETLVLYAGSFGTKQRLDTVLHAFAFLYGRGERRLRLVMCGEGAERNHLVAMASSLGLETVRFAPLQPASRLGELLRSADVHVVAERSGAAGTVMPSKLGGILASGRPVVASAEPSSGLARVVREAEAGVVVPPEDPDALADALEQLSRDPETRCQMGANGRAWARTHLDIGEILCRMESVLVETLAHAADA